MMKKTLLLAAIAASFFVVAETEPGGTPASDAVTRETVPEEPPMFNVIADIIQADNASLSLVASGHVVAVHAPFRLLSDGLSRDPEEVYRFKDPTVFTTCTNEVGHLHWHVSAGFEFKDGDYGILRNGLVYFWEVPVFWIPYLYFPVASEEGLRVMPGYYGRWGAFIMTKYLYHLAGDREHSEDTSWLTGNTRLDYRERRGLAAGEGLEWSLSDFGRGRFKIYYAWDRGSDEYDNDTRHANWGSRVDPERYAIELAHRWEVTERDVLRVQGSLFSDSYFRSDFLREGSIFMLRNQFLGYDGNEFAWEHNEKWGWLGLSVSGPINDFIGGTSRLPEFYLDVMPVPVLGLPVNYESENRVGFLRRSAGCTAVSGQPYNPYSHNPGPWAEYETARVDTYHRFTVPLRMLDLLSVTPRVAYRGTYWARSGKTDTVGFSRAEDGNRNITRSILEGGIDFSARGTADIGDGWRHMVEPYFDVLVQRAWYSGLGSDDRPYVFDAYDASLDWSDQFASRGRSLPYTWYGVTPGVRNTFDLDSDGTGLFRRVLDIDTYVALQFNDTSWIGDDRSHKLAKAGDPNYGRKGVTPVPGFRFRWRPEEETVFTGRLEYDFDERDVATAGLRLTRKASDEFSYYFGVAQANYRHWDFSSSPFRSTRMKRDEFNLVHYTYVQAGFEHELCDAIAWSPYVKWDCQEGKLDSSGAWIDFRTDCLGFRFLVEYSDAYERIDGTSYDEDWMFGFFIYLRAFGADSANVFQQ